MDDQVLKEKYQYMVDWNLYRLEQNKESLDKLMILLSRLGTELEGDATYQADLLDFQSLKIIYETSIRNFEGKIQKYNELLEELS